jgi:orotate phosphoribosyltransferase
MSDPTLGEFLDLVHGRRGHFRLESGYHAALWLDLDGLFARPRAIASFVARLSDGLRSHDPDLVCGPLLGGALLAQSVSVALDIEFCFTEPAVPERRVGLFRARYRLPTTFHAQVQGRRVAVVDDVMSAGSSLRATCAELRTHDAIPVAVGALLVLGTVGEQHFIDEQRLPVESVIRDSFDLWPESECPLCARGVSLEDPASPA